MLAPEPGEGEVQREAERLRARHQSRGVQLKHRGARFFFRTARIATGAAMAWFAYRIGAGAIEVVHKPLASLSLSPDDLGNIMFRAAVALALYWVGAVYIAFGHHKAPASDFTGQARSLIRARRAKQERLAKYYAKSKLWGLLHDPNLGQKHRLVVGLLWLLIVAAFCGGLVLLASLISR